MNRPRTLPIFVLLPVLFCGGPDTAGAQSDPRAAEAPKPSFFYVSQEASTLQEDSTSRQQVDTQVALKTEPFGQMPDGRQVTMYSCTNAQGMTVKLIDYGAIVVSVETADRAGQRANVALGFDNLEGYLQRHPYFGATVGRYCNRIANGSFTLEGKQYELAKNNGPNHLHGGIDGFDRVLWQAETIETEDSVGVTFSYQSPAGEEGYPGNLSVTARYVVTNDNELRVEFQATADSATPVNLTNHSYWNLSGAGKGTILDHQIQIQADRYLTVDATLIPTGELADVAGSALDFRQSHGIGERIDQLQSEPQGYDHCYVVNGQPSQLRPAARVSDPKSGRVLQIFTTQPGIQFYTGSFLDGEAASGGFEQYAGFCLETQHYPDSPNQPNFPNTVLRPGQRYHQVTVHRFSVEE